MINTSVNKNEHTIQSGVVDYPIGFPFYFNPDRTPQLLVKIGDEELRFNHNFELSEDKGSVVLRPTEEESWTLEGPEDFSWMTKWDGKDLLIERAVPFVQDSDYQLGRISSEQIERDFDLSVMRDQALDSKIKKLRNDMVDEFVATDSRLDSVQEQMDNGFRDVRDEFAEADKGLSNKIDETKTELQKNIDDKLPLSGGEVSGYVLFRGDIGLYDKYYGGAMFSPSVLGGVQIHTDRSTRFYLGDHFYVNNLKNGESNLGTESLPWSTAYIKKLNNGGIVSIPEKAGTMALLEDLEGKADKTELQNYLPLTGGTLTNLLSFDMPGTAGKNKGLIYVNTASGTVPLVGAKTDDNGVLRDIAVIPKLQSETLQASQILSNFIGSTTAPVTRIHAKKIGTGLIGSLLTIPDGPGTIARLEDIPETYTKEELDAKFAEIPDSADTYSKAEIDAKLSSVYKFKGSVANVGALPTGAVVGDTYNVEDTGANYAWDGSKWDKLSDTINLSDYATVEYVDENAFALVEYVGNEIRPLKTDNKNLYNNQLVLRDMLNEKDENNEFIKLTTEAQSAIPAINELNAKIGAGGGASLPDQTGNAGKFLTTDGTDVSWSDKPLVNNATKISDLAIGYASSVGSKTYGTAVGYECKVQNASYGTACAYGVGQIAAAKGAIQIGVCESWTGTATNSDPNTFKVSTAAGNFEMMSADGTIPAERMSSTAGTTGQVLTKTADGMAWQDATGGGGGGGLSDKLGFNTSAGYLYFGDISGVEDFVGFDAPALTADISGGALSIVNRWYGELDSGEMYRFSDDGFRAGEYTTGKKLGSDEVPWLTTYTVSLCAGLGAGELDLPTEGGTLARIEDIDERIGDISTALTAILGE